MLHNNKGHTQAAVTCDSPSNIHGQSLLNIPQEDFHCREYAFLEYYTILMLTLQVPHDLISNLNDIILVG